KTDVAILSHALWEQRFGSDQRVIGRMIKLDGVSKQVVGVVAKGFDYPSGRRVWLPLEYDENFVTKQRGAWFLQTVARLKPGVTAQQGAAADAHIGRNTTAQHPDNNAEIGMTAYPLLEAMVGDIRRAVLILL